jgi:hypothetical protein
MGIMLLKAIGIWVLFVGAAIVNGTAREKLLTPLLGQQLSLPLSGIVLSILVFIITLLLVPVLRPSASSQYWLVGGMWLLLTLAFEFIFGHYVVGDSWSNLFEAYNVAKGNLWILVLITTAISPYLTARIRGLV